MDKTIDEREETFCRIVRFNPESLVPFHEDCVVPQLVSVGYVDSLIMCREAY